MPLNIKNQEFITPEGDSGPKPILHTPKKSYSAIKYILQGLFIVVVVASAVFLVYIIALRQLGVGPAPVQEKTTTEELPVAVDTGGPVKEVAPGEEYIVQEKPVEEPVRKPEEGIIVQEPTTKEPEKEIKTPPTETIVQPEVILTKGSYTIYIASYKAKQPAEEEVGRWVEAGYEAMVVEANNRFRVALGQYVTAEDAKIFANQMWEAFEFGYWIGRVP